MRRALLPMILLAGLFAGPVHAQSAYAGAETESQAQNPVPNWFDPSTWTAPASGPAMAFNPAHPAGWAMFFDPSTHGAAHMAFANPATYAQFMQPQFWMQFANPNNWLAWMNPASYAVFMNPANYAYWMNPAAYTHAFNAAAYAPMMNPASYAALMNPMIYMQWMNPAAYALGDGDAGHAAANWFDPSGWLAMMDPNAWARYGQGQGGATGVFNPFDPMTWMSHGQVQSETGDADSPPAQ